MKDEKKRYKKGHFIGIGIAIGLPIGIPIGIALGNIALGPAIGLPLGLAIGVGMEQAYNSDPIVSGEGEKPRAQKTAWIVIIIGLTLLVAFASLYWVMN